MKKIGSAALNKAVARTAQAEGLVVARSKKWVAATAFFQLLNVAAANGAIEGYYVKGGFSVELRYRELARTSEDIDLVIFGAAEPLELLKTVITGMWGDFEYSIKYSEEREHCLRVYLQVRFNTVNWCTLSIDLLGDGEAAVERVEAPEVEQYGLPVPEDVLCLSRPEQIAQWLHAITKPATEDRRRVDRAKNIVDLHLFDTLSPCDDGGTLAATMRVFESEGTHEWPPQVDIPEEWMMTLAEIAEELDLELSSNALVEYLHRYVARLLGVVERETVAE